MSNMQRITKTFSYVLHITYLLMADDVYNFSKAVAKSVNPFANIAIGLGSALYNDISQNQQFNRNIELWKMQAEYNKPINQMNRLKEAGLNPLFYGLDGNSVSAPQPAPTPPTENPFNSMLIAKQMQEMDGNIAMQRASARSLNAEAEGKEINNDILRDSKEEQKLLNRLTIAYNSEEKKFWLKPAQWEGDEGVDENGNPIVTVYAGSRLVQRLDTELNQLTTAFHAARADLKAKNYTADELEEKRKYLVQLVKSEVLQKTSDAAAAAVGVDIANQMFDNAKTEGKQKKFDLNLDEETKETMTKWGIVGTVAKVFHDVFK